MKRVVFFADILGFSYLATANTNLAGDTLGSIATLLSHEDEIARHLQAASWEQRYALSDSIILINREVTPAVTAAAEFFFNAHSYNFRHSEVPVLLRGAITHGIVKRVPGVFPESVPWNLIGPGVVEAVIMEKTGGKGPRLFVSPNVSNVIKKSALAWILDAIPGSNSKYPEILWPLPPDPSATSTLAPLIRDFMRSAVRAFLTVGHNEEALPHYLGLLHVVTRSLLRLRDLQPEIGEKLCLQSGIGKAVPRLQDLILQTPSIELQLLTCIEKLL